MTTPHDTVERHGHSTYQQLYPDVPITTACRCECGAERDARNQDPKFGPDFAEWAMIHDSGRGPYICDICHCAVVPPYGLLVELGKRTVHRACWQGAA